MCDQISDAILDAHLEQDPDAKVACGEFYYYFSNFLSRFYRINVLYQYLHLNILDLRLFIISISFLRLYLIWNIYGYAITYKM